VYAHLGTVRHRSAVVEYRIEQHLEALKDRLGGVGFGTTNDTARRPGEINETPAPIEIEAREQVPEWARRDSNARPLAPEAAEAVAGWFWLAQGSADRGLGAGTRRPASAYAR
jgi:hypothetical protein